MENIKSSNYKFAKLFNVYFFYHLLQSLLSFIFIIHVQNEIMKYKRGSEKIVCIIHCTFYVHSVLLLKITRVSLLIHAYNHYGVMKEHSRLELGQRILSS